MNLLPPSFQAAALRKFLRTPVHTVNRVSCLRKPIGKYFHQSPPPFLPFFLFESRKKVSWKLLTWVDLYRVMRDKCIRSTFSFCFSIYIYIAHLSLDFHTFKPYASVRSIQLLRREKKKNVNECKRVFFCTLTFEYRQQYAQLFWISLCFSPFYICFLYQYI